MRRRITNKLRSRGGESIGETLVALLISALALVMLAGAIGSAARIMNESNEAAKNLYNAAAGPDANWSGIVGTKISEWKQ